MIIIGLIALEIALELVKQAAEAGLGLPSAGAALVAVPKRLLKFGWRALGGIPKLLS